jgi:hypothetical protein
MCAADANTETAMKHIMKYRVPADFVGSPSWHRKMFNDLLAMVNHFGMPHFFLTLTCADKAKDGYQWDEVSRDPMELLHIGLGDAMFILQRACVLCIAGGGS